MVAFSRQRMPCLVSHFVVGIVYFPPNGDCAVTVTHLIDCLDKIMQRHPNAGIILCGDFNRLNDRAIISYPLKQIASAATRKNNVLDKIYRNLADWYEVPCILPPIGSSDHNVVFVRAHNVQHVNRSHKTVSSCLVRSSDPSGKVVKNSYTRYTLKMRKEK